MIYIKGGTKKTNRGKGKEQGGKKGRKGSEVQNFNVEKQNRTLFISVYMFLLVVKSSTK